MNRIANGAKRWIGIDGGGTKTSCVIGDCKGNILGTSLTGSSNIHSNSHHQVKERLLQLITDVMQKTDVSIDQIAVIQLCLSGCDRESDKKQIRGFFQGTNFEKKINIANDAIAALYAGTAGAPGIVLIAGTGSIAYGLSKDQSNPVRVGGWGYLLGDEGSGYHIGQMALTSVLKSFDGRGPHTLLTTMLADHFEIRNIQEIIPIIYGDQYTRTLIGSLAEIVMKAEASGDGVAAGILKQAVIEKCLIVKAAISQMKEKDITIVLHGGLFTNDRYKKKFCTQLKSELNTEVNMIESHLPPVAGAYILALQQSDIQINQKVKDQLKEYYQPTGSC
ncbi:BadF/BadG/BcrA/BcrD ATPase family protein [Jeotgalibacillus haloalkalitolerans]|uniref:BadF/BadG/BcrA/BcrD ATPase family protein n=1 Tax=Jeotgalibacillus haloalkalitolerans TaxID=3104292 RepID=A0ABU5KIC7_9BACL|nr:BadF/BadG/BcrA/BcrD ATPase family protein [Jeotgalibacillus sp. HH7-29]MDZ5710997.1 BadF/BadG/BcrA/BcrD ATPase family protein [Jeotgalibacillus sp. HH7-29]